MEETLKENSLMFSKTKIITKRHINYWFLKLLSITSTLKKNLINLVN